MTRMQNSILMLMGANSARDRLVNILNKLNHTKHLFCEDHGKIATAVKGQKTPYVAVIGGELGKMACSKAVDRLVSLGVEKFILITDDKNTANQLSSKCTVDFMTSEFTSTDLKRHFKRFQQRDRDPVYDIVHLVSNISGINFDENKEGLIKTRLGRRFRQLGIKDTDAYLKYFAKNRDVEVSYMVSNLTTHTTSFFRESEHYDFMVENVLNSFKGPLNAWSAACSTGEELYSMTMATTMAMQKNKNLSIGNFLGTDIDAKSVKFAEQGVYKKEIVKNLSPSLLQQFFDIGQGDLANYVRVKDSLHKHCRWQPMNLMDNEYSHRNFDVIFLRNCLIYFDRETVGEVINKIKMCLKPGGYLFLGHSETIPATNFGLTSVAPAVYTLEGQANSGAIKIKKTPKTEGIPHNSLILLGASTGGVEALESILETLPAECPPVVIVQHMPENFTKKLADRLNEKCQVRVSELSDFTLIEKNNVYIAPGGLQTELAIRNEKLRSKVYKGERVNRFSPSVDVMFSSSVNIMSKFKVVACVLTGMGNDGAEGLKKIRDAGGFTIAQDESSSVVYGMPARATEMGAALKTIPLEDIPEAIFRGLRSLKSGKKSA